METFAERFDTSTASRKKFSPAAVTLQDRGQWAGVRLEQWDGWSRDLPETVLFQHAVVLNLDPVTDCEIRWSGARPLSVHSERGSVAVLPAGLPYRARFSARSRGLILAMTPRFLQSVVGTSHAKPVELRPSYGRRDAFLEQVCLALANDVREGYPCGSMYGESLAVALAAHLARHHSTRRTTDLSPGDATEKHKALIRDFVHDRLQEPLTLADMAAFMKVDLYAFARWFKRAFGVPPHNYLLTARIERARTMLTSSSAALVDVAFQCGFSSQSHFTTSFRRVVGVSPRVYRSSHVR